MCEKEQKQIAESGKEKKKRLARAEHAEKYACVICFRLSEWQEKKI